MTQKTNSQQTRVKKKEAPGVAARRRPVPPHEVTAIDRLRSAALWGRGLAWLLPWTSSLIALNRTLGADKIQAANRLFCSGMLKTTGAKWKAVVDPAVKDDETYIFAQNHVNHLDFVTMHNATPHFKQGVELESHFRYPFYGWFMSSRGTIAVPVARRRRMERVREQMEAEVERDHSILVFPEGTRTPNGRVGSFRHGIFMMARDLGLKVVPTAVTGMFEVMRKGSLILKPGEVTVYCDAPFDFTGLSDAEVKEQAERVRSQVAFRVDAHIAKHRGES